MNTKPDSSLVCMEGIRLLHCVGHIKHSPLGLIQYVFLHKATLVFFLPDQSLIMVLHMDKLALWWECVSVLCINCWSYPDLSDPPVSVCPAEWPLWAGWLLLLPLEVSVDLLPEQPIVFSRCERMV